MVYEEPSVVRTTDDNPVSETIVFAVADARDICPTELETPLYSAIDPDALDRLLSSTEPNAAAGNTRVEFTWADCHVAVHEMGRVVVTPHATETSEQRLLAR